MVNKVQNSGGTVWLYAISQKQGSCHGKIEESIELPTGVHSRKSKVWIRPRTRDFPKNVSTTAQELPEIPPDTA